MEKFTVSFFSNFLNHHQIPFCNEMFAALGENFKFIATEKMTDERLNLGWGVGTEYPYALRSYESKEQFDKCMELGEKSDFVIIGNAPDLFVLKRINENKLTFRYSERLFKRGFWRIADPRLFRGMYRMHTRFRNKNVYMLCASAYAAYDCARIFAYKNKMFKWGYFPEVKPHLWDELFQKKANDIVKILWAGRLIDWKHTEDAIRVAKRLKSDGYVFELDIIGTGELKDHLESLAADLGLGDCVRFLGSMAPENVRAHMEKANIYLFTSDQQEGWGAVLNESMNSGCAVVASHAIGSVPFLVKPMENGLAYRSGDIDDLYEKTKYLLDHPEEATRMGKNALQSMEVDWSPKRAATNLIELAKALLAGRPAPELQGPGGRVEVIRG